MEENKNLANNEPEMIEYEDVKRLPIGAFVGIGLAFGVAAGFSAGNILFGGNFLLGMSVCIALGLLGGLIVGFINRQKKKPE
jgi:hypothetical protein